MHQAAQILSHNIRHRAEMLRDQVKKTWNPPLQGLGGPGTAAQTSTMLTLSYVFGKDFLGELTSSQQLAVDLGCDLLEEVLVCDTVSQTDVAIVHPIESIVCPERGLVFRIWLSLPPEGTNPNARSHWRKKAEHVSDYRMEAKLVAINELNRMKIVKPRWSDSTVQVTYVHKTKAYRDRDNIIASMKSAFDGLQDAGVLINDYELLPLPAKRECSPKKPGVLIEVWKSLV
jgi:hypothetical protein